MWPVFRDFDLLNLSMEAKAKQLTVPALILWGEKDRLLPPSDADRFHDALRGSVRITLPGIGHCPMIEDPAACAQQFKHFLNAMR